MEHRWGTRRKVALDVTVFHQGISVAHCKSRDIGRGGIFVEGEFPYPAGTELELEVLFDNQETLVRFHLHARVAHVARDGMGLVFKRTQAGVVQALMEILAMASVEYSWDKVPAARRRGRASYMALHPRAQVRMLEGGQPYCPL